MEAVTTRDGQVFELHPCPIWCTGEHFAPDEVIDATDGFHHYSRPTTIQTSDRPSLNQEPVAVELYLKAWVLPLDAEPGPTQIALSVDHDDPLDLTATEARQLGAALIELSRQVARRSL